MSPLPEDPSAGFFQPQPEQWLGLVTQQQELATRLREFVDQQRRLAARWNEAGAPELAARALSIERNLHGITTQLLHLEQEAVDLIANTVGDPPSPFPGESQ